MEGSFIGYKPHLLIWGASQFPKGSRLPVALFGRNFRGPPPRRMRPLLTQSRKGDWVWSSTRGSCRPRFLKKENKTYSQRLGDWRGASTFPASTDMFQVLSFVLRFFYALFDLILEIT